ncbi:transcriptional regulator protein Pur-beta isoform X3 [Drosophila virilis]|uniref:transcriptional regulator protein Pur-beta isoform X3 n=1 Tax=Drosophila virilis TaxID=7244 RepID=UPI001396285A|nr:transcriptional activator protein Pur-beta isoform X3 [Drosophila virilis]
MSDLGSGEEGISGSKYNASNMEGSSSRNDFDSSGKAVSAVEQELASKMLQIQSKRFYLDVKQNRRGRFIKVAEVSQTITRGGPRSQIALPAQGMIEFRDALTDLLEEFGANDGGFKGDLPEERHMKVDNKNFYFDIGQNNRGVYMRISEVKNNFRTSITIPEKCWLRFRDIFNDYCDKMKKSPDSITADNIVPTSTNSLK